MTAGSDGTQRQLDDAAIKAEIEAQIEVGLEEIRNMDVDKYLSSVPDSFEMITPAGDKVTAAELRAELAQLWSIIIKVIDVKQTIDSISIKDHDHAVVMTNQRFHRLMKTRDGLGQNDVITTQRHEEEWVRTPNGWRCMKIKELGGDIWVDGEPYCP